MRESALLPRPRQYRAYDGEFVLPPDLRIAGPTEWAAIVRRVIGPGTGLDLLPATDGRLRLVHDAELAAEAYTLTVTDKGITLTAADDRGVNWAAQTLRQLLPPVCFGPAPALPEEPLVVPAVEIVDRPRFGWRGVLLDTARHFMPYSDLIAFVDRMAMHKYNVLHLHLTEDQGWRFESVRHPRLTEVGSWRAETRNPGQEHGDGTPHGGFYTQDQLRALVAYAEQRGITVVPEIEFPGHVRALLAAYPELGNDPTATHEVATGWGVFPEVLGLRDETLRFVFDIWEEVLDIFPSRFVHIGGDECPREEWLVSEEAKRLAAERGLAGPEQLQRWFTETLRDWFAERGRQVVGWDEINDEGVLDGAVTMVWRDPAYAAVAAEAGGEVVMAPTGSTYFDYYPSDRPDEPRSIGGNVTTQKAYAFDPVAGLSAEAAGRVLGTQCQLWTEYMPSAQPVEYMMYPRACAHSEVAWSDPEGRSWEEFSDRLSVHLSRLEACGVNFRPEEGPLPWQRGGTGAWRRAAARP